MPNLVDEAIAEENAGSSEQDAGRDEQVLDHGTERQRREIGQADHDYDGADQQAHEQRPVGRNGLAREKWRAFSPSL